MFLTDPAPTQGDLRFSVLGIPVRVHPLFWLSTVLLGGLDLDPKRLPIWIGVVFVSILVHEMGHALMVRHFGWRPNIVLYTFGGLAIYRPTRHDSTAQMLISAAGPGAGFLLAGLVVLICRASGYPVLFARGGPLGFEWYVTNTGSDTLNEIIFRLIEVNILWGLINLLPVYPLDGGQFLRELLETLRVRDAVYNSLLISTFVGAGVAVFAAVKLQDYWLTLMFGMLAYSSFTTAQQISGRGGGYGGW